MSARKIKARAIRKPARRKPTKAAPVARVLRRASPRQATPARLIKSPLLSAAVVSLAIFAGSAALPRLSEPHHPALKQIDDAAFQRELDRAMAEGGVAEPLPFVVPAVPVQAADAANAPAPAHAESATAVETPARAEAPTDVKQATDNSVKTPAEIKHHRATQHAARQSHRRSATHRSGGLDAMAAVSGNDLIAEARKYLGRNPTGWSSEWCGRFLDMVLKKTGRKGGGNLARGYLKYGKHLPGPQVGAIAVFSRRGGGHVGIVTGVDSNGNPIVISGNYNDRVAIATYPASRVLGYVDPD
jgi:uncharacterized protein (TIGR02594 family)